MFSLDPLIIIFFLALNVCNKVVSAAISSYWWLINVLSPRSYESTSLRSVRSRPVSGFSLLMFQCGGGRSQSQSTSEPSVSRWTAARVAPPLLRAHGDSGGCRFHLRAAWSGIMSIMEDDAVYDRRWALKRTVWGERERSSHGRPAAKLRNVFFSVWVSVFLLHHFIVK